MWNKVHYEDGDKETMRNEELADTKTIRILDLVAMPDDDSVAEIASSDNLVRVEVVSGSGQLLDSNDNDAEYSDVEILEVVPGPTAPRKRQAIKRRGGRLPEEGSRGPQSALACG